MALLRQHGIERVVDIRRFPTSRKHPQFKQEALASSLAQKSIDYQWLGDPLGGYRREGYESYMETAAFRNGVEKLEAFGRERRTAFMCAEIVHFRCHRRFVADALVRRGWQVLHITDQRQTDDHFPSPQLQPSPPEGH